jgi:hypothetical protein
MSLFNNEMFSQLTWDLKILYSHFFYHGATAPSGSRSPQYRGLMITLRHTTHGRTPLDEWSARRSGLYLTTYNTQKRQASMTPEGFEPTIPASERPQTHALDQTTTEIGILQWLGLDKTRGEFLQGEYKTRYSARREKNLSFWEGGDISDTMGLCAVKYRWDNFLWINEAIVCVTRRCVFVHSLCVFLLRVLCDRWTPVA